MERRKDNKGRVLKTGENQRKTGLYQYRYNTPDGKRHTVYATTLTELRQKEKDIQKDLDDGMQISAKSVTLNDMFEMYFKGKTELKQSTRSNYLYLYKKHIRDTIGKKKITDFKFSDINNFYKYLLDDIGFKPHSLESVQTLLHPVFELAVRDCYIRTNPTNGIMTEIKKARHWETPKRHALTVSEQERIIEFVSNSEYKGWLNLLVVLLGTGMRISEACGLRWEDCDFINDVINVNHNLIYRVDENGKANFHITTPKTNAGIREIPMLTAVRKALLDEKEKQMLTGFNKTVVDGYSGFIFMTRDGNVTSQHNVTRAIKRIVEKCNEDESEKAKTENREPLLVRDFTAHNLRHTFCTRFCENESNIKVIQEIMGHSDVQTTMNVYAEATLEKKKAVISELDRKIKIL